MIICWNCDSSQSLFTGGERGDLSTARALCSGVGSVSLAPIYYDTRGGLMISDSLAVWFSMSQQTNVERHISMGEAKNH